MRTLAAIALGFTLAACGARTGALASPTSSAVTPSASPSASPSPTPSVSVAPSHVPGSAVRVTVNGHTLAPGEAGVLAMDGPSTVVVAFPFAMDRPSVDRWLPQMGTFSWTDDRTLTVTIAPNTLGTGFKIPESRSADGASVVDLFVVNVAYPPSQVLSTYSAAELIAGAAVPKAGAPRLPISDRTQATPSPDGTKLLAFGPDVYQGPVAARVVDIATRSVVTLTLPPGSVPTVALWKGNDAVVLVGDHVWVEPAGGGQPRAVADLASMGTLLAATVSPTGALLAAASTDQLAVIDLATGAARPVPQHHDTCGTSVAGATPRIAWSTDERRLAAVECDGTTGVATTRFTDLASGRTIATVDGGTAEGWAGLAPFVDGSVGVVRPSSEHGEGFRFLWVVFDFDGNERTRFLARSPQLTLDGRYLVDIGCCVGPTVAITDLRTGDPTGGGAMGWPFVLHDGRILVLSP